MNVISTENEQRLPANIRLVNTPDIGDMFTRAHGLLREAPCNIVVNNHFAESPDYAPLRDFLARASARRDIYDDQHLSSNPERCRYGFRLFVDASQFFPGEPRESVPSALSAVFNGLFYEMRARYPKDTVEYDVRSEMDKADYDFHMDGADPNISNKPVPDPACTRLIIPLTAHGTLVAGCESHEDAPLRQYDPPQQGYIRHDIERKWTPPEKSIWELPPLSIAFITHCGHAHVPVIHSPYSRGKGHDPQKRGLAVLQVASPERWT